MNIDLTGKRAVITGSSGGIGFECARILAEAGARVAINGRSAASVERALARLYQLCPEGAFDGIIADLSDPAATDAIIAVVPDCDLLINNAAVNILADVLDQPDDDYRKLFEINTMSAIRLTRHYLPAMVGRGWGRVIFHNSEQSLRPSPGMAAYGASKAALLAFARAVAADVEGGRVTVNTVIIGPSRSDVTTALHQDIARQQGISVEEVENGFFANYRPASLLQRLAEGQEVAAMVAYLCSSQADATHGCIASVEGGTREVLF